jgi:hypothetical protein
MSDYICTYCGHRVGEDAEEYRVCEDCGAIACECCEETDHWGKKGNLCQRCEEEGS